MSTSLTFPVGETGHKAVYVGTNLDGTPATDVVASYRSNSPTVCTVDPATGDLVGVSAGSAVITGTGTRGTFTHDAPGDVTITPAVIGDDFTGVLDFS